MTIKAFVVDDSAVVRKHLTDTLVAGGINVIGSAGDPLFAWPKMCANLARCDRARRGNAAHGTASPSCARSWPSVPRRW